MFVLTFIARSKHADFATLGSQLDQLRPTIAFTQTYADELQGAFTACEDALAAALLGARNASFWVGIGVGELTQPRFAAALGAVGISDCLGSALSLSRSAVEQAQTGAPPRGICLHTAGDSAVRADQVTGLLRLLYRVTAARTEAEWRVLDLIVPGVRGQQKAVAAALGISSQAVSKTLVRAYWHEELASRALLEELMDELNRASQMPQQRNRR